MFHFNSNEKNDFISRFSNRIEIIGKDGVIGIMKNTKNPINMNRQSFTPTIKNNRYFSNYPMLPTVPTYSQILVPQKTKSQNSISTILSQDYSKMKLPKIIPHYNQTEQNKENIDDHGYIPYTLKDYRKLDKEVKLGGLGANIGGEEWKEKAQRRNKMGLYGGKVNKMKMNLKIKVESPEEVREKQKRINILNSKRNKITEYSKNLETERKKPKINFSEMFKIHRENIIKVQNEEPYENCKEIYLARLNKIKSCLVK